MMISPRIRCPIFVVLAVGLLISSCGNPEGEGQTVISGKALAPLAEATLFAYREGADLKGPPFAQSQPSAADGGFTLALPPGKYILVLRKREGGETTGPVRTGPVVSPPSRLRSTRMYFPGGRARVKPPSAALGCDWAKGGPFRSAPSR